MVFLLSFHVDPHSPDPGGARFGVRTVLFELIWLVSTAHLGSTWAILLSQPTHSAGTVRFGSGSGHFALNAEPEPGVRFRQMLNLEPEPGVQVQRVRFGVQQRSNAEPNAILGHTEFNLIINATNLY